MADAWQYIYSGHLLILFLLAQMAPIFFEVWMQARSSHMRIAFPDTNPEISFPGPLRARVTWSRGQSEVQPSDTFENSAPANPSELLLNRALLILLPQRI